jgi:hypothetical protein
MGGSDRMQQVNSDLAGERDDIRISRNQQCA